MNIRLLLSFFVFLGCSYRSQEDYESLQKIINEQNVKIVKLETQAEIDNQVKKKLVTRPPIDQYQPWECNINMLRTMLVRCIVNEPNPEMSILPEASASYCFEKYYRGACRLKTKSDIKHISDFDWCVQQLQTCEAEQDVDKALEKLDKEEKK